MTYSKSRTVWEFKFSFSFFFFYIGIVQRFFANGSWSWPTQNLCTAWDLKFILIFDLKYAFINSKDCKEFRSQQRLKLHTHKVKIGRQQDTCRENIQFFLMFVLYVLEKHGLFIWSSWHSNISKSFEFF